MFSSTTTSYFPQEAIQAPQQDLISMNCVLVFDKFTRQVPIEEIVLLEGDGNYTLLHLSNGRKVMVSKTLKQFENVLCEGHFARIHKSYLINLKYLIRYDLKTEAHVQLRNGSKIEVSRRRRKDFEQRAIGFMNGLGEAA